MTNTKKNETKAVDLKIAVSAAEPVKTAEPVKKAETTKAAETVKAAEPAKAAGVKKEAAPKKAAAKKTPVKKEIKTKIYVQFMDKEVLTEKLVAEAKKAYIKAGNKEADIKTIDIYVKPEENTAYYVVNGVGSDEYRLSL